ncbi:MAG: hypothetical protein EKK31_11545 [Hyphomicrobiales bacterium]|nr:MAG: hypothetical protein EKK31_11545 [Hyphomicrobiales bacterium]
MDDAEKELRHAITDEVIAAYKEGYNGVMTNFPIYRDPTKEATRQGLAKAFAAFTKIHSLPSITRARRDGALRDRRHHGSETGKTQARPAENES